MNLANMAAEIFIKQLGSKGSALKLDTVIDGIKQLLPSKGGDIDIAALVQKFTSGGGGLAALASSWLGDGGNSSLSAADLLKVLGEGKVSEFAGKVGVETGTAASGLSDMIPQLIDKASSGGNLLEGLASGGAASLLKKLF